MNSKEVFGTIIEPSKFVHFKVGDPGPDPAETGRMAAQETRYALLHAAPASSYYVLLARADTFTDDQKWATFLAAYKEEFPTAAQYKWYWEARSAEAVYDF